MTFSFYDIFNQPCHSLMVIGVVVDNPLFVVVHVVNVCLTCICNPCATVLLLVSSCQWCIVLQPQYSTFGPHPSLINSCYLLWFWAFQFMSSSIHSTFDWVIYGLWLISFCRNFHSKLVTSSNFHLEFERGYSNILGCYYNYVDRSFVESYELLGQLSSKPTHTRSLKKKKLLFVRLKLEPISYEITPCEIKV